MTSKTIYTEVGDRGEKESYRLDCRLEERSKIARYVLVTSLITQIKYPTSSVEGRSLFWFTVYIGFSPQSGGSKEDNQHRIKMETRDKELEAYRNAARLLAIATKIVGLGRETEWAFVVLHNSELHRTTCEHHGNGCIFREVWQRCVTKGHNSDSMEWKPSKVRTPQVSHCEKENP